MAGEALPPVARSISGSPTARPSSEGAPDARGIPSAPAAAASAPPDSVVSTRPGAPTAGSAPASSPAPSAPGAAARALDYDPEAERARQAEQEKQLNATKDVNWLRAAAEAVEIALSLFFPIVNLIRFCIQVGRIAYALFTGNKNIDWTSELARAATSLIGSIPGFGWVGAMGTVAANWWDDGKEKARPQIMGGIDDPALLGDMLGERRFELKRALEKTFSGMTDFVTGKRDAAPREIERVPYSPRSAGGAPLLAPAAAAPAPMVQPLFEVG